MTQSTAADAVTLRCPTCDQPVDAGELYCEACGAELSTVPAVTTGGVSTTAVEPPSVASTTAPDLSGHSGACHACGSAIDADGYCTECGAKARSLRDHFSEQPAAWVAAVCDRGVRHSRNEDAVALEARAEAGSHAVLVVCDGVSTSVDSDVASLAAARAARDVLASSSPSGIGTAAARVSATAKALEAAADVANEAVINHTATGPGEPASCTFVAAVVDASVLVVGWVGDSRAYWLPTTDDPHLLTTDDSYAAEQIADGVPRAEAESGSQAHAITRWLGVDAPDHTPRTVSLELDQPGWVLLCSDGLWNYCSEPSDMAALVRQMGRPTAADPHALADALVDWANLQGGADNITVALARIDPREEVTHDGNIRS